MKNFLWKGISLDGLIKQGKVKAKTTEDLTNHLLAMGIALISHQETSSNRWSLFKKQKIKIEKQANFFSSLSLFLDNGIDLITSLEILYQEESKSNFKQILQIIIDDIKNGLSLSSALKEHSEIFKEEIIEIIKCGEQTGSLGEGLKKIALHQNNYSALKQVLIKASLLPIITAIASIMIALLLFIFAVPRFESFFTSINKPLPTSTKIVIGISKYLRSYKIFILALVLLSIFILTKVILDRLNKHFFRSILYKIPLISNILINYDLINFLESLSLFLESGKTLRESLESASNVINNKKMRLESSELKNEIVIGKSLSNALRKTSLNFFPAFLRSSVLVGENSAQLSHMLKQSANYFRVKLDKKVNILTSIFAPLITLTLGLFIAILMIALYMPVFSVSSIF